MGCVDDFTRERVETDGFVDCVVCVEGFGFGEWTGFVLGHHDVFLDEVGNASIIVERWISLAVYHLRSCALDAYACNINDARP